MNSLFRPDAFLWRWCSRLLDVMALSVLWFFCSIPLVTIGAASAALYDAAVRGLRREEAGTYVRFFRTFRRELKPAVLATLLWGAVIAGLLWGGRLIGTVVQEPGPVLASAAVFAALLFFALGTVSWLFPLLSRFEFSFLALNRTAWQFLIVHLPSSVLLCLLLAVSAWACARFLFPVCFLPCVEALLASLPVERGVKKHLPEPPAQAV